MKEWWFNLSLREKQTLSLGGFLLSLVLLYLLLWIPLANTTDELHTKLDRKQKLLVWMKETHQRIIEIEKNQFSPKTVAANVSLLSILQRQLNKTTLVTSLEQLRQADTDSVQLGFKHVEFDKLSKWLIDLWRKEGLVVKQINLTSSESTGIVSGDIILKAQSAN